MNETLKILPKWWTRLW